MDIYANGKQPVFICEYWIQNVIIEYLKVYGYPIKHTPYVYNPSEFPIFIQRVHTTQELDISYALVNTEQLTKPFELNFILNLRQRFRNLPIIFDYSHGNITILKDNGFDAVYMPYKRCMQEISLLTRHLQYTPKQYDIALIGVGDRRVAKINELRAAGFTVHQIEKWGDERDREVAKCNLLLNIHFREDYQIFEELRCRRWLNVNFPIVSEYSFEDSYLDSEKYLIRTHIDSFKDTITRILRPSAAPEQIFCTWTDTNPLSDARQRAIDSMQQITNVAVHFITPSNLETWIKPGYPLHRAYPYLSAVHKSDYLRCYLMHHYGGGYTDVKPATGSWKPFFDELNSSNKWILGYKEVGPDGIAHIPDRELYEKMCANWESIIGCGSFICKPYSLLTQKWLEEVHRVLDTNFERLVETPAKNPRDQLGMCFDGHYSSYPLRWTQIMGDILHPLIYIHANQVALGLPRPNCTNYQ